MTNNWARRRLTDGKKKKKQKLRPLPGRGNVGRVRARALFFFFFSILFANCKRRRKDGGGDKKRVSRLCRSAFLRLLMLPVCVLAGCCRLSRSFTDLMVMMMMTPAPPLQTMKHSAVLPSLICLALRQGLIEEDDEDEDKDEEVEE